MLTWDPDGPETLEAALLRFRADLIDEQEQYAAEREKRTAAIAQVDVELNRIDSRAVAAPETPPDSE